MTTTRMRDFYALYTLYKLKKDEIDYKILKEAIERTYARGTWWTREAKEKEREEARV